MTLWLVAADAVLVAHALFVLFVVAGLVLILIGGALGWRWVRERWFRLAHLAAIGVVTVQSWLGIVCPLTSLEMALRARGGAETYAGSFVTHHVEALLYYRAPAWAFIALYTVFGIAVVAGWFVVPPAPRRSGRSLAARSGEHVDRADDGERIPGAAERSGTKTPEREC